MFDTTGYEADTMRNGVPRPHPTAASQSWGRIPCLPDESLWLRDNHGFWAKYREPLAYTAFSRKQLIGFFLIIFQSY